MESTHTNTEAMGKVDFERHVFFFRDANFQNGLMTATGARGSGDALPSMQHIVLNPRDWPQLWKTMDVIKSRCTSLRNLVVIAPWPTPDKMPSDHTPSSWAPYEDWDEVFDQAPTEAQLQSLRTAIERGAADNAARNERYRAQLDEAAAQVTEEDMSPIDHVFGRTRVAMQKLEGAVQEMPGQRPNLYLWNKEELMS